MNFNYCAFYYQMYVKTMDSVCSFYASPAIFSHYTNTVYRIRQIKRFTN